MKPDVCEFVRVHTTDWGDVVRVDLNQLGARLPSGLDEEASAAWSEAQIEALCDTMEEAAGRVGGDFRSFAEWTVLHNRLYDGTRMRDMRRERFGEVYRAAITTLGWAHPEARFSTRIQAVAYVPKNPDVDFEQALWKPEVHYETESMALSPTTISRFGGARQIYISGVVAWDDEINPVLTDDPRAQVRYVLRRIQDIFEEAGGSLADVVRLRPFAHDTEIAAIIREEIRQVWKGYPRPAVMMSDSRSFGNPPKLYTEIQVMGVLPDGDRMVTQDEPDLPDPLGDGGATVIRSSRVQDWELVHIGELRAPKGADPEAEPEQVVDRIEGALSHASLSRDDVCLAFAYASSPDAARAFGAAAGRVLHPDAVHVLPCPPMPELGGRQLKVELTARRLLKRV